MKIDFSFQTPYGTFSDALCFEDGSVPDEATIEAMKTERLNNWLAVVTPKPPQE